MIAGFSGCTVNGEGQWYIWTLIKAIGWMEGLHKLAEAGIGSGNLCVRNLVTSDDMMSIEMILRSKHFPNTPGHWEELILSAASDSTSIAMQELIVGTFAERRKSLTDIALSNLAPSQVGKLGITEGTPLDANADSVYQTLFEKGVSVPNSMRPGLHCVGYEDRSIYDTLFSTGCRPSVSSLNLLYDHGFHRVNGQNRDGSPPLLMNVELPCALDHKRLTSIFWFTARGASPTFQGRGIYPSILFHLADFYKSTLNTYWSNILEDIQHLISRCAELCDCTCSDSCRCWCSSNGCLPAHMFWNCNVCLSWTDPKLSRPDFKHDCCANASCSKLCNVLDEWISLCNLNLSQSRTYLENIIRAETFGRLGMAHTCCAQRRPGSKEEDQQHLREEDKHSKVQLELILEAIHRFCEQYDASVFSLRMFIKKLDEILPELSPYERCRYRLLSLAEYKRSRTSTSFIEQERKIYEARAAKQKQLLAEKGYSGWDFLDVIRDHFAIYLDASLTVVLRNAPGGSD